MRLRSRALASCVLASLAAAVLAVGTSCMSTLAPSHPDHAVIVGIVKEHAEQVLGSLERMGGFRVKAGAHSAVVDCWADRRYAALAGPPYRTELVKGDAGWRVVRTRSHWGFIQRTLGPVSNHAVWAAD